MAPEIGTLVDHERGLVSRRIFVDAEVYALEIDQIFGRCWLYLAHESQIPADGEFVTARMGEEPVIVCRAASGRVFAFLNMCPSCGRLICRIEEGRTDHFRCPYHGWTFTPDGRVIISDQQTDDGFETETWGLVPVAQIDAYQGCIFATLDPDAPPLDVYLGDIRWGLDLLFEQGSLAVAGVTRWLINCNWKFAAESSVNDVYHGVTHMSATIAHGAGNTDEPTAEVEHQPPGFTIITAYGHGLNAELIDSSDIDDNNPLAQWRQNPLIRRRLGAFRMRVGHCVVTLFPNVAVSTAARQLYVWHPRGPAQIEAMLVTFTDTDEPPELRRAFARTIQSLSGPAGLLRQDEGENWEQSMRACHGIVAAQFPLNYQMGLGHGDLIDDERSPPRIDSLVNEHRQLWFYRNWARAVAASTWPDWQQPGAPLPESV